MLGDNIKNIRLKRGYSQKHVAEKVGVSEAYISLIESNQRTNLGSELLEKIANVLDVNVSQFYKVDESEINEIENLKDFESPEKAMKFILEQPLMMAYGGYDLEKMSDEEVLEIANDMLMTLRISVERRKRK